MWSTSLIVLLIPIISLAEYCGEGKMPIGFEVSIGGKIKLNCERPDCMDKEFSECPERAESISCPENGTWVGGVEQRVDGTIRLRCCSYPRLLKHGEEVFNNITLRHGTYFESAVKFIGDSKTDMEWFDIITDIQQTKALSGYNYTLTVNRFNCSQMTEDPPAWWMDNSWPFFD